MLTLIYFILILSTTIFVHELGHFIFAKKAGVHVYEFSLGMGPVLYTKKRKNDETKYSIRLVPIGGFVSLAGEQVEIDKNIPKSKLLTSKKWSQRFMTIFAGVMFNFIFAIFILFILSLFYGGEDLKPLVGAVDPDYPAYYAGIEAGDEILKMNGERINTWDDILMFLEINNDGSAISIEVKKENGDIKTYSIPPKLVTENGEDKYLLGIGYSGEIKKGFFPSVKYAFTKFLSIFSTIGKTIKYLVTGQLALNRVSGPIGIYSIVDEQAKVGFDSILYLIAFLSVNVGFVNLLPIPAFDGGRIIFLIFEKIKGSPVKPKVENIIHTVGFVLLMGLMVIVTINDILKLGS